MKIEMIKPLKPKPKPGAACGFICAEIVKNILFRDDEENDAEENEEEDDDDEVALNNDPDEIVRGDDCYCPLLPGCCQQASVDAQSQLETGLVALVAQGGVEAGARAVQLANDVETQLAKKLKRVDKSTQGQATVLLQGLRAQARSLRKESSVQSAERFEVVRAQMLRLTTGELTQSALRRAESTVKDSLSPSALASFLAAQLKRPMGYDIRGFFPMFKAVLTVSPAKMHSDTKEIQRLLNKFEKLDQACLETTWTEIADTWATLYEDYNRMQAERSLLILEQIFGNPVILKAVSYAKALHNIAQISYPPEEILKLLKEAKVELKRRVDEYMAAADRELVRMQKIQNRQQQFIGGVSILLISIGTSVGNFAATYFYNKYFSYDHDEL